MEKSSQAKSAKNSVVKETWRRLKMNKLAFISLIFLCALVVIAILAPVIAPYDYAAQDMSMKLQNPSWSHPFGTDDYGRDFFSRILIGARYSLMVSFVAVALAAAAGTVLGLLAAFYQRLDNPIMRVLDVFMGIPGTLMAIVIISALGNGLFKTMTAIAVSSTPSFARVVRSAVLSAKQEEYVEAARSIGANDFRLMFKHILPNAFAPLLVRCTLSACDAILMCSTLSFLGLGVTPPTPEWGCMLSEGKKFLRDHLYMSVIPGAAIMLTTYSLNLLGDGLRDALDPRLRR